jgi:hypothetical protein
VKRTKHKLKLAKMAAPAQSNAPNQPHNKDNLVAWNFRRNRCKPNQRPVIIPERYGEYRFYKNPARC